MKHYLNRIKLVFILTLTLFVVAACSLETSPASNEIPSDAMLSEEALIQKYLSTFEAQAVVAANGKIAFSSDADGDLDIYIMNPDGAGLSNITNAFAGSQSQPDWSPDGTKLAFANSSTDDMGITQNAIWVMNTDGTNATQLTFFQEGDFIDSNYEAKWSPDGTKIAFTTQREGDRDIYIMDADGSNPHNLFVGGEPLVSFADFPPYPGDEYDPSWSPDGTKILYTASRATGTEIATVAVEGASAETEVLLTTGLIGDYSEPVWSPDGQLITYTLYYVWP